MKKIFHRYNSGFTLVEVILYITIVSLILFAATTFVMEVIKGQNKSRATQEVQVNARFVLEKITQIIHSSKSVDTDQSLFDTSPGILVLNQTDTNKDPTVIRVNSSSNVIEIQEGTNPTMSLSSNEVVVTNLIFRNLSTSKSPNIKIEITLSHKNPHELPDFKASLSLEKAISIRQ